MTVLAGTGVAGVADGVIGSLALGQQTFVSPSGVAVDAVGTVYVSDSDGATIWRVDVNGLVTRFAGTGTPGFADGPGASAAFNQPTGIAVGPDGSVYVADMANYRIRKIDTAGNVSTLAGSDAGYSDGQGSSARFNEPLGVVLDGAGNVYVADWRNSRIRKIDPQGNVTTFSGTSPGPSPVPVPGTGGPNGTAQFGGPAAVAIDASGNLYVADRYGVIEEVDPAGNMTILAGTTCEPYTGIGGDLCFADGPTGFDGGAAFSDPTGITVDAAHNVIVADTSNQRIRKIDTAGNVTTLAGQINEGIFDGVGAQARFGNPWGLALDRSGAVVVADGSGLIRRVDASGLVTTVAGMGMGVAPSGVVSGTHSAEFNGPAGVVLDSAGSTYLADTNNHQVRKIDPAGNVTTLAGTGQPGFADGSGGPSGTAQFQGPIGLALDGLGNVLVADTGNNRIRKIDAQGNVTTVAGNGTPGAVDGTGGALGTAELNQPHGLVADAHGNVYVADSASEKVRKIDSNGNVTTVTGNGTWGFVDGAPGAAELGWPFGIVLDASGNLLVADQDNAAIRKIDPAGNVTTVAGTPGLGLVDGTGGRSGTAKFSRPAGLAIDGSGNLYVADMDNEAIREVDPSGNVTTLGGNGQVGFANGTGGLQGSARFSSPTGVAMDSAGNLVIADSGNNCLRKLTP